MGKGKVSGVNQEEVYAGLRKLTGEVFDKIAADKGKVANCTEDQLFSLQ